MNIISEKNIQYNLFDTVDRKKSSKYMEALDSINNKYGRDIFKIALLKGMKRNAAIR